MGRGLFYRDDNIIESVINNYERRANFIETDEPNIKEAIAAYNEFLNGRCFILEEVDILIISDIMGLSAEYTNGKYTLYDVNGDNVPELILQGARLYILSYENGKLSVWYTNRHFGGSSYFVNGGNLYYRHGGTANRLWHGYYELGDNGDANRHFDVELLYTDYDNETWVETYFFSEDGDEREITKAAYDEMVLIMSNDDQIEWQEYNYLESTLSLIR